MNIGFNTFLFTSPVPDRGTKLFTPFARWGFDGVEIAVEQPQHINPPHVKRELEKQSLRPGPVCAGFPPDRDLRGTPGGDHTDWKSIAVTGLRFLRRDLK